MKQLITNYTRLLMFLLFFIGVEGISIQLITAQSNRTIALTGVVEDSQGAPIIGANVYNEHTKTGTITDVNGKFALNTGTDATLKISYLGYKTQIVAINGRTFIKVQLVENTELLEDVVVVGYGVQNKEQVTSAITKVTVDDNLMKNVINPLETLQGQVAGLTMVRPNGGDVNGEVQLQLRGVTSLSGGLSPLVVVDGIVGVNLNNVILEEIESINVLKDGSAAAIYGTRGTNGVIIITTKKQRSGRTKVEFNTYLSTQTISKELEVLSADEYREALTLKYSPEEIANYDKGSNTDWFKEVTRTPLDQYYNLSFSSGTDKLNYHAAINYKKSQGLVDRNNNDVLRTNISVNQKALEDKINISYNVTFSNTKKRYTDTNILHQAFQRNPTEPVYDEENQLSGRYYLNQSQLTYYNPVAMLKEQDWTATWQYFTGSTKLDYHIIEGLTASVMGSIVTNSWRNNSYKTRFYPVALGTNGTADITSHLNISKQLDVNFNYIKSFGFHNLDVMLGYSYYDNMDKEHSSSNSNFDTDFFGYNNIGAGYYLAEGKAAMNSWKTSNKLISFFTRVQYNFNSKYLLSASLRREGSTRFGKNNKWGMFPAVSVGWRMEQEPFLKNVKWLDMLKLRAGMGMTGNQDIGDYRSLPLLSNSGGKMYYNGKWINTYAPASNPNPDLQWEKKTEYNFGVDFSLFNNRISGAVDYYIRNTNNLLWTYDVPVPPNLYSQTYDNVGKIQNKGLEITLNFEAIRNKNFTWNSTLIFSRTRNKLVSFSDESRGYKMEYLKTGWIAEDIQTWTHYITEGGPLGNFYAKVYTGLDKDGNPQYKDLDGIEGITDADRQVVGNAYPKFQMSFNNNFTWKNFDLSVQLRGSYGNDVLNIHRCYYDNLSYLGGKNTLKMALKNPNYKGGPDYSSRYVEDASFIKLDNLTVGYTFKFNKPFINTLRLHVTGQNLLTITKYKGVDPEVAMLGLAPGVDSYYYYPRTRIFTFGANISF